MCCIIRYHILSPHHSDAVRSGGEVRLDMNLAPSHSLASVTRAGLLPLLLLPTALPTALPATLPATLRAKLACVGSRAPVPGFTAALAPATLLLRELTDAGPGAACASLGLPAPLPAPPPPVLPAGLPAFLEGLPRSCAPPAACWPRAMLLAALRGLLGCALALWFLPLVLAGALAPRVMMLAAASKS